MELKKIEDIYLVRLRKSRTTRASDCAVVCLINGEFYELPATGLKLEAEKPLTSTIFVGNILTEQEASKLTTKLTTKKKNKVWKLKKYLLRS